MKSRRTFPVNKPVEFPQPIHRDFYRILLNRDSRYDGCFFVGVQSTGVYCRPICPARKPNRINCVFYRSATEAEKAGFRPCLRCHPESAPGSPAWMGTKTTVGRAMRLISEGFLESHTVPQLAECLGIGTRHLSRLFQRHAGATPKQVANTRRVQCAMRLIRETGLPLIDIAFEAGFGSVRRFNDAFRRTYQRAPSTMRRSRPIHGNISHPPCSK